MAVRDETGFAYSGNIKPFYATVCIDYSRVPLRLALVTAVAQLFLPVLIIISFLIKRRIAILTYTVDMNNKYKIVKWIKFSK